VSTRAVDIGGMFFFAITV